MYNANGAVIYDGPSAIDGAPIVVIATGLAGKSGNQKTGAMVQTWILRADMSPGDALRTGADVSICGGCMHRPDSHDGDTYKGRTCYVNISTAPSVVWKTWQRGRYRNVFAGRFLRALMAGRNVRLGSYGDPAAVPAYVWRDVLAEATGWTGYTHQASNPKLRDVLEWCQVSADSCEDAEAARVAGVGSFRVLAKGETPAAFEVVCPASNEAGNVTDCNACQMCTGFTGSHVAIQAHGIGAHMLKPSTRRPLSLPVLNVR